MNKDRKGEIFNAASKKALDVSEFIHGAEWADQHPKEGLIDIEEVCRILKNMLSNDISEKYAETFIFDFQEKIKEENNGN